MNKLWQYKNKELITIRNSTQDIKIEFDKEMEQMNEN